MHLKNILNHSTSPSKHKLNFLFLARKQKLAAKKQAEKLLASLGISKEIKLNEYEMLIASQLVEPRSITVSWKDVAGLENLVTELRETVIVPIQKRKLFSSSSLMSAPKVGCFRSTTVPS